MLYRIISTMYQLSMNQSINHAVGDAHMSV